MKKVSDVFKSIRFAKGEPRGKKHSSTDDEEHGTVGEMDFDQQLAHAKKRAMQEDLRNWFNPNHPEGDWKRVNSKGEVVGDCAREPGEPKPKCMSKELRSSLTKKEKASAVRRKREEDPNPERQGAPINVTNKVNEDMEQLDEKNKPTNPELWSKAIAQAKSKFDVYPSAYANGWASKWYKSKGGGWKTVSEAKEKSEYDYEGDMARGQLQSIVNNAQRVHDMLEDSDNLPEWVQSKITKAEDYMSTVANYMEAEMNEETEIQESGGPVVYKKGDDHIEKYGEDSFALYKDGKKAKYYTSLESAKEAMNEDIEHLDEKNVPTSPEKWSQAKAQAKAKFDVYPSAYANGWAAKKYKEMGGGWKSVSEAKQEKPPFDPDPPKKQQVVAGKYGVGYSTARHLARMAMQKQSDKMKKPIKEEEMSNKAQIVKTIAKKKKDSADSFQKDPIISKSQVKM